jgi:2-methylisocitrate lyase-like PEP mutase family enzyme
VARTDARYAHGIDDALRRADMFLSAGADVLFVESPESLEEMRGVAETFRGVPLLANMVEGGRTPYLSTAELESMGFKIALFPATGFLASAHALRTAYAHLQSAGTSTDGPTLYPFSDMNKLMGFPLVHAFEEKWTEAT